METATMRDERENFLVQLGKPWPGWERSRDPSSHRHAADAREELEMKQNRTRPGCRQRSLAPTIEGGEGR